MRDNYNNYKNEPLRGLTDHSSDEAKQNVNKKN